MNYFRTLRSATDATPCKRGLPSDWRVAHCLLSQSSGVPSGCALVAAAHTTSLAAREPAPSPAAKRASGQAPFASPLGHSGMYSDDVDFRGRAFAQRAVSGTQFILY
jgi:hypothetical protein